jgi:hypothetical protein
MSLLYVKTDDMAVPIAVYVPMDEQFLHDPFCTVGNLIMHITEVHRELSISANRAFLFLNIGGTLRFLSGYLPLKHVDFSVASQSNPLLFKTQLTTLEYRKVLLPIPEYRGRFESLD